ncbi:Glu-tRNA(Gln) amidotransferase GatDE subunit E, partial [Candidatus Bathyarchaeota archaeon CG07_land_8_20_14_0_80_47_9]
QILDSEYGELFETVVKESGVSPTTVAAFMTETLKALKRDGIQIEKVSDNQMREIFKCLGKGELTKEAIPDVAVWLSKHEGKSLQEAVDNLGLKLLSREELEKMVDGVIKNNKDLIEESGAKAFGPLMGIVMKEARGKANTNIVNELIKKKLEQLEKN